MPQVSICSRRAAAGGGFREGQELATRIIPVGENPRGGGGSASIDTIAFYGAIGIGGYLVYTLALQGSLGTEARKIASQLYATFNGGKLPPARPPSPTPVGGVPTPGIVPTPGAGPTAPVPPGSSGTPDPAMWLPELNNPEWFWDITGNNPGWAFHWGTDINNDANWWCAGRDNLAAQYGYVGGVTSANALPGC